MGVTSKRLLILIFISLLSFACSNDSGYPVGLDILEPSDRSELARVYVTTPGNCEITSKTEWVDECTIEITDAQGKELMKSTTAIKGRGNSTWRYPKKPYALKLDSKAEILGMPKHKRWVLLANWMDRTLLRNDVAFEMGRRTMEWAPRGQFVELFLNGKFLGNYYLCEQIKIDKMRVNVDKIDEETDFSNASQISGGYILEFDVFGPEDEINYFYTSVKKYPVTIKEPDEEVITSWNHPAYEYIKGYVNRVEQILEEDKNKLEKWSEVASLIDVQSYIDWWLIHEVAYNIEARYPKSCYMYKKRDGKLYAGPVWDFDWETFRPDNNELKVVSCLWYGYFFRYPEFKREVVSRWAEVKDLLLAIDEYIMSQTECIRYSNEINFAKWPISGDVNGDEKLTFDQAIENMRAGYSNRLRLIDDFVGTLN